MAEPPPHFIVFVPGYMGSRLRNRRTGEIVWLDIPALLRNPFNIPGALSHMFEQMSYPNDDIEPDGILDEVVFLPPLFKQEQYGRMLAALKRMGYDVSGNPPPGKLAVYPFAYDWRQDNRISARQLGEFIQRVERNHPGAKAILMGHSNGGIVSRWYIEKEGGKDHVSRLFLLGSPWDGAPKAFQVLQDGMDVFLLKVFNRSDDRIQEKIHDAILSFPSFYHLIPSASSFLEDSLGVSLDPFRNPQWLPSERQRQMLLDGRRFNEELGTTLSVETLCFFGIKNMTTTRGKVTVNSLGAWGGFEWQRTEEGDGTVPISSAIHPNAREKLPFVVSHGDIYISPPVLEKIEFELLTKYRLGVLAQVTTQNLTINFEPDQDAYSPSETIQMWATVHKRPDGSPVYDADIEVSLELRQALPGFPDDQPQDPPPSVKLRPSEQEAGRYEGQIVAPQKSAYYRLAAIVTVPGQTPVPVEELILVEGVPDWMPRGESAEPPEEPPTGSDSGGTPPPPPPPVPPPAPITGGPVFAGGDFGSLPATEVFRSWEETFPTTAAEPPAPPQPETPERYLGAEITEGDGERPLPFGEESSLAIFIDEKRGRNRVVFQETGLFNRGESRTALDVILSSPDFIVHNSQPQKLRLPRQGKSRNKARFDIEPRHSGACRATAYLYKNKNFVQGIDLEINVAGGAADGPAIAGVTNLGRPVENLAALRSRDVLLIIKNQGDGFDLTLIDEVVTEAHLKISPFELSQFVAQARKALLDVVYLARDPNGVSVFPRGRKPPANVLVAYQAAIDIPEEVDKAALKRLAEDGLLLYQNIFNNPAAGLETRQIGERLRRLARESTLKLQIVSQNFLLPWGMLYLGDDVDNPQAGDFLGMQHMIEHIPMQASPPIFDAEIPGQPALEVSLNVDPSIDQFTGQDYVARQLADWQALAQAGKVNLAVRKTGAEWIQAMKDPGNDQLLYFYGHAQTPAAGDPAGPNGVALSFDGQSWVSLRDLRLRDPQNKPFPGNPLVFINACESAELSPLFYGGFMPYFTSKGARGMIGAECEVPIVFAAEWAQRFFERFLYREQPVGQIFLDLRREFYANHRNLLGLLYALYCDGDTKIAPGIVTG